MKSRIIPPIESYKITLRFCMPELRSNLIRLGQSLFQNLTRSFGDLCVPKNKKSEYTSRILQDHREDCMP